MRVIAGKLGGRKLPKVSTQVIRPTTDRVKEALFSSLDARGVIEGSAVLDLFSGTGALGIEAISRGATVALFVERDRKACRDLEHCLKALELTSVTRVISDDALRICRGERPNNLRKILGELGIDKNAFELVFADPPYDLVGLSELPRQMAVSGLVAEDSLMILESREVWTDLSSGEVNNGSETPVRSVLCPQLDFSRAYGETVLSYLSFSKPDQ